MTMINFHQIGKNKQEDFNNLTEPKKRLGVASSGDLDRFFLIGKGDGEFLYDVWDKKYIDCTSQGWVSTIGHSNRRVIDAVMNVMDNGLVHVRPSYYTIPKLELAYKLTELAPDNLNKVNFCLHGSLAVEGAIKLVLIKRPNDPIAVLDTGFCGRSIFTGSLSWDSVEKPEFYQVRNEVVKVPSAYCYRCKFGKTCGSCSFECIEETDKVFSEKKPSMFIYEPVQGNGGQIAFPHEYHKLLRETCTRHGVTMIADEMQTAFGKLPELFASYLYDIKPDIITVGKALGGGFPLAATLYGDEFDFRGGDQTFTFASFPLSMVAALETLKIIEEERICEQARDKGEVFKKELLKLQDRHEIIGDIRQEGLLIGIELVKDRTTKEPYPDKVQEIIDYGINTGGVLFGCDKHAGLGCVLKVKPPSVIGYNSIARVIEVLDEGLRERK